MAASGSFTDVGVSNTLLLPPQETLTVLFTVAGAETFNGTIALEVSRDGAGATWEPARATDGTEILYVGENIADFMSTLTVKNETAKDERYRVHCSVFDGLSDAITYALTEVAQDVLEPVVFDKRGRALIYALDSGGVRFPGEVEIVGAVEAQGSVGAIAPSSVALATGVTEYVATGTISAANIVATDAGAFGHAAGVELLAAPGATYIAELVSLVLINDRATAAYTAGGNITVNRTGGSAITGLIAAAASLGAAADTYHVFVPLAAAGETVAINTGLSLVSSAAFTNPGTAAGVLRWKLRYRLILVT